MAIVTKTYITKSNTIIKDSCENSGINPVIELSHGRMLSRGLIYFDHTKLQKLVEDKTYGDISKLHHVLHMTNTSSLNKIDIHKPCMDVIYNDFKERATSFDLIFFLINKEWDCGKGFDYVKDLHKGNHIAYSNEGSNWFQYKNYFKWDEEGIFSTDTLSKEVDKYSSKQGNLSKIIIGIQHFDFGNENIEIDVTDTVNKFITNEIPNYGIGIAFASIYEEAQRDKTQYVGFFTQHTHSFFEPYIETTYDETIEDDRLDFYLDKENKLYFYSVIANKYTNLDNIPTCTINGTEYEVKQASKGIYYATVKLSSDEYEVDTMMYDVWSNINYNSYPIKDVELSFVTKSENGYFSLGLPNSQEDNEIVPSVYGINEREQIKQGDIRKINIDCRIAYTTNQLQNNNDIEYRLFILEGTKQYDVIKWTKTERGYNENYFLINTQELIPSRYYVDLKIHKNLETFEFPKVLQFDIVSDVSDEKY